MTLKLYLHPLSSFCWMRHGAGLRAGQQRAAIERDVRSDRALWELRQLAPALRLGA